MAKTAITPSATGGKFTIGFGLVNVPVAFRPLIEPSKPVSGRILCPKHMQPIKQVSRCSEGTKTEHILGHGETVTGYPVPDDPEHFVVLDPAVLAELVEERTGRLELHRVVPIKEVDPLYFAKTYLLWPQDGGEPAFDLLATVLREQGSAAVGSVVLSKQTVNIVIRWSDLTKTLVAHVCEFSSRIRWHDVELVQAASKGRVAPDKNQLVMATQLLSSLPSGFDASEVEDSYSEMLLSAIRSAATNQPIKAGRKKIAAPTPDLLAALKASIEATKNGSPKSRAKVTK